MKNYQQEAKELLEKMGIKFSAKFIKNGFHFIGETEKRDIFRVALWRGETGHSFRFGQSISKSTGNGKNVPTEYDVLACLQKYDVGSFEDFISDFGYSTETAREKKLAEKIYNAVVAEYEGVKSIFTSEEIEQLQEIN